MGLPWRVRVKDSGSLVKKLGFKVYEGFRFMAEDFRMKSSCFGAESSWLEVRSLKRRVQILIPGVQVMLLAKKQGLG
jgi:hypothetical protein